MISVVIPVYRNESTLVELSKKLVKGFKNTPYELIFVDDASPDQSFTVLKKLSDENPSIHCMALPRNIGQHRAVIEGLKKTKGEVAVVMDADLQDPPEAIELLLAKLNDGFEAVFAGRCGRYESKIRHLQSKFFKLTLHWLCHSPRDAGMFVAMSRKMIDACLSMPMEYPFLISMIAFSQLSIASVPVVRNLRKDKTSAYSFSMRCKVAMMILSSVYKTRMHLKHNAQQLSHFACVNRFSIAPRNYPYYIQRHIEEMLPMIPPGARVLDIGCGQGRFTEVLAEKGIKIEGLDLSPELIELAKTQTNGTIPYYAADLLQYPKQLEGAFDAVVGFFVLHHLPNQSESFKSIHSLLKPGGIAAFIEPNPYNPLYYLQIFCHPRMKWKNEKMMVKMRKTPLVQSIEVNHFKEFSLRRFGFFPPFCSNSCFLRKWERKIESLRILRPILPFQMISCKKSRFLNDV